MVINSRENVAEVFADVLISLFAPDPTLEEANERFLLKVTNELNEFGISWTELEQIVKTDAFYIEVRRLSESGKTKYSDSHEFARYFDKFSGSSITDNDTIVILEHLAKEHETSIQPKLSIENVRGLKFSPLNEKTKWIKTENLFLAFTSKNDKENLLRVVENALDQWHPNPARMILSKFQSEIEENGVKVQDEVLQARYAFALWYYNAIAAQSHDRTAKIEDLTKRHSEMLFSQISPEINAYTRQLLEAEDKAIDENRDKIGDIVCQHFQVNLDDGETKKIATDEHNLHTGTKTPEGWHLQTGHIFGMEEQYWVCLSPSCDLIPREQADREKTYGKDIMPFLAVKLQKASDSTKLKSTDGRFVHLSVDNQVTRFAINTPENYASRKLWHTLYAHNLGKFDPKDKELEISSLMGDDNGLALKTSSAKIVGHLRYEYALSLAQQFSQFINRIGLDFLDPK